MNRMHSVFTLAIGLAVVSCGGNPEPEVFEFPPPVEEPEPAPVDDGSARLEAMAADLCAQAAQAMQAGDYTLARQRLEEVLASYPGTTCADGAPAQLERAMAMQTLTARIYFGFNLSEITDEAAGILAAKADVMNQHQAVMLTVEGHCDERGSLEYNQALGLRRAQAAADYLGSLGIDGARLRVVTFGEERPLAMGRNESAWAQNRRSEFVVTAGGLR